MKYLYKLKSKDGVVLMWAVVFLMIFSILGISMLTMSSQNLRETTFKRDDLKSYYLAESGIDLAYTALMHKESESDSPLIDTYISNKNKVHTQTINMGDDTINITIETVDVDSKSWVKITSIGTVTDANLSSSTFMRINVGMDNFVHIIREDN